jgi:hypothetical protein
MFRENDNLWKQIVSFKGCGQNNHPLRWEWRRMLLVMILLLVIGVLIAAGLDSLCFVDWSGGE